METIFIKFLKALDIELYFQRKPSLDYTYLGFKLVIKNIRPIAKSHHKWMPQFIFSQR